MIYKKMKITLIRLMVDVCVLFLSLSVSHAADVTLTVGDGSGSPGSSDNSVEVSLDNPNDTVSGIQINICDVDNYLVCDEECDTTDRTTDFSCVVNEITDTAEDSYGCCRVIMTTLSGGGLEVGTGPVFNVKYDISSSAPEGECRDLNPEDVSVVGGSGEDKQPLDVTSEAGEFCFITTSTTTTTTTPPITISPDTLLKSHWVPLPYLMVIVGEETHFKPFATTLDVEPPRALLTCFPLVWNQLLLWDLVWVMPSWLAGREDQTVTIKVATVDEMVEGTVDIKLLPLLLDSERNLR